MGQGMFIRNQCHKLIPENRQGVTLPKTMELGSREAVREAAAGGLGVGIMNAGETGQDNRVQQLTITGAKLDVTEYIACLKTRKTEPQVAALLEIAAEMGQV